MKMKMKTKMKMKMIACAIAGLLQMAVPAVSPGGRTPLLRPDFSVCCVGDSITEGGRKFVSYRVPLERAFARAGWTVEFKGSHVKNGSGTDRLCEGWGGKTAWQVSRKYVANAEANAADVLLIHSGHNYNMQKTPQERIVSQAIAAHRRIIAAARARNPKTIVFVAQVITSRKLPKYSYIPALNRAIAALAAELNTKEAPVVAVDMASGWDVNADTVADMVHPSASGAEKMACKWMAAIRPFVASSRKT